MKWTDEKIEQLKELWEQGKSDKEIAQVLGLTRVQVQNKRKSLHLISATRKAKPKNDIGGGPYRELTKITDMLIVQFLSEGYSLMHIAAELNRDYDTLKQYCRKYTDRLKAAHEVMMHYDGIYAYKIQNRKEGVL